MKARVEEGERGDQPRGATSGLVANSVGLCHPKTHHHISKIVIYIQTTLYNIARMIPHTLSLSRGLSIFSEFLPYFLFTGQTWLVIADKCYCESGPCWQPIGNLGDIYLKPSHIFNHTTHFEGTEHFR